MSLARGRTSAGTVLAMGTPIGVQDLLPASILIAGILLRLVNIDSKSLWLDEGISLESASAGSAMDLLASLASKTGSERFQPLYFVILHYWKMIFGDSEISIRLLSILPGIAVIIILMSAARKMFGKTHALWTGIFVTTSGFAVVYSQEVRPYSLLLLMTSSIIWLWASDISSMYRRKSITICFSLCVALLCAGSVFSVVPLAALAASDALVRRNWKRWAGLWIPAGIVGAVTGVAAYGPIVAFGNPTIAPQRENFFLNFVFVVYGITVGPTYGPSLEVLHGPGKISYALEFWPRLGLLGIVCIAVGWAVSSRIVKPKNMSRNRVFELGIFWAFLFAVISGSIMAFAMNFNWLPRHAFYLFPFFALAVPLGINYQTIGGRLLTPLVFLIGLNASSVYNFAFADEHKPDDYKSVARFIKTKTDHGVKSILLSGDLYLLRDYYKASNIIDGRSLRKNSELGVVLPEITRHSSHVELIINRKFYSGAGENPERLISACYDLSRHVKFAYFDIYEAELKQQCS